MPYELKLFTGNAHRTLADEIAACLGIPLGQAEVSRFSDGEIFVQINDCLLYTSPSPRDRG